MASDTLTYYLQGGPCNGQTGTVGTGPSSLTIVCGGHNYRQTENTRPNGDVIYLDAGAVGGKPSSLKAPQALKGWKDLQRSINHTMPASLQASARSRNAALRQLARARKVRL